MDNLTAVREKLKIWESQFQLENDRKPKKEDIRNAPIDTRELYKKYQQLRTTTDSTKFKNGSAVQSLPDSNNPWDCPSQPAPVKKAPVAIDPNISIKQKLLDNVRQNRKRQSNNLNTENYKTSGSSNESSSNTLSLSCNNGSPLQGVITSKLEDIPSSIFSQKINFQASESMPKRKKMNRGSCLIGRKLDIDFSIAEKPLSHKNVKLSRIDNYDDYSQRPYLRETSSLSEKHTLQFSKKSPSVDLPTSNNFQIVERSVIQTSNKSEKSTVAINEIDAKENLLCVVQSENINASNSPKSDKSTKTYTSTTNATISKAASVKTSRVDNGNYVKINLRVKRFSRKGAMRQKFLQKQQRRDKFRRRMSTQACFKCNEVGHWANKCPLRISKANDDNISRDEYSNFVEIPVSVNRENFRLVDVKSMENNCIRQQPIELDEINENKNNELPKSQIDNCKVIDTLRQLGYNQFRPGQEAVVNRIISGQSTLLMMPTGGGKSLCYQLPALFHQQKSGSVALVICPLISLMQDQLARLPPAIKGAALNSTLKPAQREELLAEARRGELAFIMVSPEALVDHAFLKPSSLPSISFVCIDEAHCLADWSHHFRPSYLRVCKLLRTRFSVNCFLGLSATCTNGTLIRICKHLDIKDPKEGCIRSEPLPTNLTLTASRDTNRDEALLSILRMDPIAKSLSILIYCATRDQTSRVSSFIRTALKDVTPNKVGRRKLGWTANAYHAGLTLAERARLQKRFMQGSLRILVATVAFGMGLDKPDLHCVIHYSRPKSFENYVQEIGRAGRDGKPANCHVFMPDNSEDRAEVNDLQRHVYSNHVDYTTLKRLIRLLFAKCNCIGDKCSGHLRSVAIEKTVQELDIREETLSTLMCYLELHPAQYLHIVRSRYQSCNLQCYRGPKQLAELSHKCLAIAGAISIADEKQQWNPSLQRSLEIDMIELSDRFGWDVDGVKQELAGLEWTSDPIDGVKKTGVLPEFKDWSWMYWLPKGNFSTGELDSVVHYLFSRVTRLEQSGVANMRKLTILLNAVALPSVASIDFSGDEVMENSLIARQAIADHFTEDILHCADYQDSMQEPILYSNEEGARATIRSFIRTYEADHQLTGRAVACVLHGIGTPCYPAYVWGKVRRFWRSMLDVDWPTVYRWANEEIRKIL